VAPKGRQTGSAARQKGIEHTGRITEYKDLSTRILSTTPGKDNRRKRWTNLSASFVCCKRRDGQRSFPLPAALFESLFRRAVTHALRASSDEPPLPPLQSLPPSRNHVRGAGYNQGGKKAGDLGEEEEDRAAYLNGLSQKAVLQWGGQVDKRRRREVSKRWSTTGITVQRRSLGGQAFFCAEWGGNAWVS
jgi:hypothetical protein